MGFWGIATKWVSEAWPLVGFMRHGHLVGFWGMATSYLCIFNVTQDWRSCWPHCAVSFKGMATGWVPKTWPQIGFLRKCHCHWMGGSMNGFMRHGYWMGFWGMATQWVSETWPLVGFLRVSEAWPLSGFLRHGHWLDFWSMATRWISELDVLLRHGHWVGFWGMATGWVSEACRLPLFGCPKEVLCLGCIFWPKSFQPERIIICKKSSFSIENLKKIEIEKVTDLLTLLFDKLFSVRCQQTPFYFLNNF